MGAMSMLYGSSSPATSFSATLTQGPQYTVETTGTVAGGNFQGQFSGISSQRESSSSFQSTTGGVGSTSGSSSSSGNVDASAVVNQVAGLLAPQIEETVQNALSALTTTSTVSVSQPAFSQINTVDSTSSSVDTSNQQTSEVSSFSSASKSTSAQSEAALVSQIIGALTPQITESVPLALAGQSQASTASTSEQQSSFDSQSSF